MDESFAKQLFTMMSALRSGDDFYTEPLELELIIMGSVGFYQSGLAKKAPHMQQPEFTGAAGASFCSSDFVRSVKYDQATKTVTKVKLKNYKDIDQYADHIRCLESHWIL